MNRLALKRTKILLNEKNTNLKEIGSELEILQKLKSPYLNEMIESFEFHEKSQQNVTSSYSCIITTFCDVNRIKSTFNILIRYDAILFNRDCLSSIK